MWFQNVNIAVGNEKRPLCFQYVKTSVCVFGGEKKPLVTYGVIEECKDFRAGEAPPL